MDLDFLWGMPLCRGLAGILVVFYYGDHRRIFIS